MSMNQFSSETSQTVWWAWQQQHHHHHNQVQVQPAISVHSSAFQTSSGPMFCGESREPMFQKTLTPSDVGKLNRLVIPKQHAEKYFPLGSFSGEASTEKGLLLTFEDELGKCWRFRYSYWNSSQSYVLTRGWSRFVKEKRLDAGDIVTFHRAADRFFIGWRRRLLAASTHPPETAAYYHAHPQSESYLHSISAGAGGDDDHVHETPQYTQTTSSSGVNQRRSVLRLFGVNMECHEADNNNNNIEDHDQDLDDGSEPLTRPDSAHATDQQQQHYPPF